MKIEIKQAKKKPCEWTCPKCGNADIHRKHLFAGSKIDRSSTNRNEFSTPHIDFGYWHAEVKLECILHHCRICYYEWTTEVLAVPDEPAKTEQPKEKLYSREEVAKVLCLYCKNNVLLIYSQADNSYFHATGTVNRTRCKASDWLNATEGADE